MDKAQRNDRIAGRYSAELMNLIFTAVLDQIEEGVIISDDENRVIFVNQAAEKIDGIDGKRSLGKRMEELYAPTENTPRHSHHSVILRTGRPASAQHNQYIVRENHKTVTAIDRMFPINIDKQTIAVYSLLKDLPTIKQSIEQSQGLYRYFEEERPKNGTTYTFDSILGNNAHFIKVLSNAKNVAKSQANVLIYGETGTGKELFAQSIHDHSLYQNGPFISVNCAAIPATLLESMFFGTVKGSYTGAVNTSGLFEQADSGTIFLDEINSMDIGLQAKILKAIENKTVRRIGSDKESKISCRILCALNEDPIECIRRGKLRKDLYYRLASCILHIPPLRERKDDIPLFTDHFRQKFNQRYHQHVQSIDSELMGYFFRYPWPGNVRELQHVLESAYSVAEDDMEILRLDHLSPYYKQIFQDTQENGSFCTDTAYVGTHPVGVSLESGIGLKDCLEDYERTLLAHALEQNGGNITATAKTLRLTRQTLQHKIKKYHL